MSKHKAPIPMPEKRASQDPPIDLRQINAIARDRFGTPVQRGAAVIFKPEVDLVFQVLDTRPVLDPRLPAGLVDVTIQVAPFTLRMPANQPYPRFVALNGGHPMSVDGSTVPDPPAEPQ